MKKNKQKVIFTEPNRNHISLVETKTKEDKNKDEVIKISTNTETISKDTINLNK